MRLIGIIAVLGWAARRIGRSVKAAIVEHKRAQSRRSPSRHQQDASPGESCRTRRCLAKADARAVVVFDQLVNGVADQLFELGCKVVGRLARVACDFDAVFKGMKQGLLGLVVDVDEHRLATALRQSYQQRRRDRRQAGRALKHLELVDVHLLQRCQADPGSGRRVLRHDVNNLIWAHAARGQRQQDGG